MSARYEYEIVRHGEGMMWVKKPARDNYEEIVHDYAARGWRLVQVFAPSVGSSGYSKYFDLIFQFKKRTMDCDEELKILSKMGKSTLSNTLPIMREMGIIYAEGKRKPKYRITSDGERLLRAVDANEMDELRRIGSTLIERSEILNETYYLVKNRGQSSPEEMGHLIAERLNIKWKGEITYKNVGRTCLSILAGFGLAKYKPKRTRGKKYGIEQHSKLVPLTHMNQITILLKCFDVDKVIDFDAQLLSKKEKERMMAKFKALIDLDLVKHIDNKVFGLSEHGIELKNSKDEDEERNQFRKILMRYKPLADFVEFLVNKNRKWSAIEMGKEIEEYNETVGQVDSTRKFYGGNLISWLKKAGIIEENDEWGKYRITRSFFEIYKREKTVKGHSLDKIPSAERSVRQTPLISEKTKINDGLSVKLDPIRTQMLKILSDPQRHLTDPQSRDVLINSLDKLSSEIKEEWQTGSIFALLKHLAIIAYKHGDEEALRKIAQEIVNITEKSIMGA